jgi:hypothetical protein
MDAPSTPIDLTSRDPSIGPSESSSNLPNAFTQMMRSEPGEKKLEVRDRCQRPVPTYNQNYNPFQLPPDDRNPDYSPYIKGEPLFDDRLVIAARLPRKHIVAGASRRKRTAWVWHLGYALVDTRRADETSIWACKLCTYS